MDAPAPSLVLGPPTLMPPEPRLIFATELDGTSLATLFEQHQLLHTFAQHGYGLAMAIGDMSPIRAALVRQLNAHQIYTVAWMLLPAVDGYGFNLQNYPQAIAHYHAFRDWANTNALHFAAVGMHMLPPADDLSRLHHLRLRDVGRWLIRMHDNALFEPGRTAYLRLIDHMHHDGYAVHTYQLPLMVDDRRAGTSFVQYALDVPDLPVDLEVLMCHSSLPIEALGNDMGGALISSYGMAADCIGIGYTHSATMRGADTPQLAEVESLALEWSALERDMLLATRYTDTIYIFSLEGCVAQHMLPRIATINWDKEPRVTLRPRLVVRTLRFALLLVLLIARHFSLMLSWLGWLLFLVVLLRRRVR